MRQRLRLRTRNTYLTSQAYLRPEFFQSAVHYHKRMGPKTDEIDIPIRHNALEEQPATFDTIREKLQDEQYDSRNRTEIIRKMENGGGTGN